MAHQSLWGKKMERFLIKRRLGNSGQRANPPSQPLSTEGRKSVAEKLQTKKPRGMPGGKKSCHEKQGAAHGEGKTKKKNLKRRVPVNYPCDIIPINRGQKRKSNGE